MNENTPFFSIGIASYNYSNFILKGLEQIRKQSFKDYEVIVSDDCSTDDSVEVIRNFIEHNPDMKIRLITKDKNEGLISNKNTIIENHRGQYLLLCDADDWMSDNLLENAYNKISQERPDRLICDIAHIDINGNIIQREHLTEYQTKWGWLIHHGSFYKSEIIRNNGIRIESHPDDVFFIMRFTDYCNKISILNDEIYYYWLVHKDSSGRKNQSDFGNSVFFDIIIKEKKLLIDYINLKKKELSEVYTGDSEQVVADLNDIKLVFLKLYCFDIIFRMQELGLKEKKYYYKKLHEYCINLVPDMWDCSHIKRINDKSLRKITMKAIKLIYVCEKTHIIIPFIICFHILTRFVYIDQ